MFPTFNSNWYKEKVKKLLSIISQMSPREKERFLRQVKTLEDLLEIVNQRKEGGV